MVQAYGIGGVFNVLPSALTGNGPPIANSFNTLGQEYFDKNTIPPTLYIFNGQTWVSPTLSGGTSTFAALTVTGAFSSGSSAIVGNETVGGNLTVTGLSTLTGGINTAPIVVAAAASPQTANGRSGQVTFSGVSIAAGATQSFVINNTSIAAIGTVISYSMVGATAGAALTIASVTNVAGTSSTITVTNGTGATTSTANITFTFIVLN